MIFFFIGGLLCVLNHFKLGIGSNQEIYMALAKWWSDPSWIPGSFYFSDPPGTRIGFTAIMHPFWGLSSFENISMAATFVNLFALGGLFFLIAKEVTKPTFFFIVLMHLTLFSGIGDLSFYSGEWMFGSAEPKTFAYIFALWGLLLFLRKKEIWAFLLLSTAAYFHVLVAGWILLILLLDTWYVEGFKKAFKNGLVFIVGVIPLFFYLLSSYFQKGLTSFAGADEIFINNLNNHLRPWLTAGREDRFYFGLFYAFLGFIFALYRYKKCDSKIALLYRLSIYSFLIPAFFTLLAPWDWFTPFVKIFPFRLTLMQKVLLILAAGLELSQRMEKVSWRKPLYAVLSIVLLVTGGLRLNKNIFKRLETYQDQELLDLSKVISQKYQPGTTVFYLDTNTVKSDDRLDPLSRMARVNVYFVNKFLPFSPEKILEWHRRQNLTRELQEDPTRLDLLENENIDVIISKGILDLNLIGESGEFKIYETLSNK